ncbi:DUF3226 domain-containing protein [Spirosoma pollinicola]|uniref:DUF4435 domain-containing protein n=1 Tax=Spirosoma pollinicola TaxID=2057025 RepID=A0A2K8Z1N5_9BACT|nr:DUF3226 domain-containing protein [Spirosoma pollinicola]AUD03738.1 hypothetical protein CWM47_19025 [Spirosoma pollinicola]
MSSVQFYVEGPSDRKFLKDIIHYWYNKELPDSYIDVLDGKDNLKHRFEQVIHLNKINFAQNQENKIHNVVILDADDDFTQRKEVVAKLAAIYQFDFFLWPNNSQTGDLESILEIIYNPTHQPFFDCWQVYESCLSSNEFYYLPNRKGKIFAYLESILGHSESQRDLISKPDKRNFLNKDHWNLDPKHLPLKALKEFLDPFFSIQ